jgi:hypothetical protein
VIGWELDWVMLAVSLFDDILGADCPCVEQRVNMAATDIRAGLL